METRLVPPGILLLSLPLTGFVVRGAEGDAAVSAPPLTRAELAEKLAKLLDTLPANENRPIPASPELEDLITTHAWHAVGLAESWLEALDPERKQAARAPVDVPRDVLVARLRAVAGILEKAAGAPALGEVVERVVHWGADDWKKHRGLVAIVGAGQALHEGRKWTEASAKLIEAEQGFLQMGHKLRALHTTLLRAACDFERGSSRDASRAYQAALELAEAFGSEEYIALALNGLGAVSGRLGDGETALMHLERAAALFEKLGDKERSATILTNLGGACHAFGRYEESRVFFERALPLLEAIGNDHHAAAALDGLGNALSSLGRKDQALPFYERALVAWERVGYEHGLAQTLYNLGHHSFERGEYDKALAHHERALGLREKLGIEEEVARSLTAVTTVQGAMGRFEEALRHAARALPLLESIGNEREVATLLNDLGNAQRLFGRHAEALRDYGRALEIRERIGDTRGMAASLAGLGAVHRALGDYDEALLCCERALDLAGATGEDHLLGVILSDLGSIRFALGQHERALECYERAGAALDKAGDRPASAAVEANRGLLHHRLGRHEAARAAYEIALRWAETSGREAETAIALNNLGVLSTDRGQHEAARGFLERALALSEKAGHEEAIAATSSALGRVHRALNEPARALALHERALMLSEKSGSDEDRARALLALAEIHADLGRWPEARARLLGALDCLSRARRRVSSDQERVAYGETWQSRLLPALRVALGKGRPGIQADQALAFRVLERLRGVATAELLAEAPGRVKGEGESALAGEERDLRAEIDSLARRIQEAHSAPEGRRTLGWAKRAEELRADLRAKQRRLEARWEDVVSRMAREEPEEAALIRPQSITLEDLRAKLPARSAYLAFALGKEGSLLVLVDEDGLRSFDLPDQGTIEPAVERHLEVVRRRPNPGDDALILATGRELHDLLLRPAEEALRGKEHLLVSPEGILYGLPLETLVAGASAGQPAASARSPGASFLIRRFSIAYVHSGTAWNLLRRRGEEREKPGRGASRPGGVLVLADPSTLLEERGTAAGLAAAAFEDLRGADLGRLPHTREEALSIIEILSGATERLAAGAGQGFTLEIGGRRMEAVDLHDDLRRLRGQGPDLRHVRVSGPGVDALLGGPANRKALENAAAHVHGRRLIHIAAHGVAHPDSAGLSGILLSPEGNDSGFLWLMDVLKLELRADLVVLSACETQLGRRTSGEGYQGLVRAFLHAGARCVIASSWRVPDRATARFFPAVYRHFLERGLEPADALRQAQLEYLDSVPSGQPELMSPFYWGAWTAWGDALGRGP